MNLFFIAISAMVHATMAMDSNNAVEEKLRSEYLKECDDLGLNPICEKFLTKEYFDDAKKIQKEKDFQNKIQNYCGYNEIKTLNDRELVKDILGIGLVLKVKDTVLQCMGWDKNPWIVAFYAIPPILIQQICDPSQLNKEKLKVQWGMMLPSKLGVMGVYGSQCLSPMFYMDWLCYSLYRYRDRKIEIEKRYKQINENYKKAMNVYSIDVLFKKNS